MDTKHYTCLYCYEEFIPKRRHVQKFCSATCRSKAHHQKTKIDAPQTGLQTTNSTHSNNKIEKISVVGISNAAVGALAADALKNVFTNNNNKPATKGDILALRRSYNRYQRILNMPGRPDGTLPYYDMETKCYVYLKPFK